MITNPIFFYIASSIIIVFALLTLVSKNVIHSLLSSILVFFAGAVFFYILGSEYNAIIQAAVYGFAVPILIGLSIMFTSGKTKTVKLNKTELLTLFAGIIFVFAFSDVITVSLTKAQNVFNYTGLSQTNFYDILSSFAKNIFIDYVWSFEMLSLLLTIVIAGLTLFRKRGT